ncbi:MAG: hypothetical protein M3N14_11690 [Bacteroidota bacterium]|nr:hypothetical protein [Bacteroidota bacterium]
MPKFIHVALVSVVLLFSCKQAACYGQGRFLNSPDAYLGQTPPEEIPLIFAPGLLAGDGTFAIDRVAFSKEGKEIYYCTNTSWFSAKDLKVKYFRFDGKKWSGPAVLNEGFAAPCFAPGYRAMYFTGGGRRNVIWRSDKTATGWSAPSAYLRKNYGVYDFMPTTSGNGYAGSNGTWGKYGDYSAWQFSLMPRFQTDTTIESLGSPPNAPGFNGDFYIAPDESYMIVSADETKDFECELYISFRKTDHSWTRPKSLGEKINRGPAHRFGVSVSPDGKYLFYTQGTSEKDCAIYWVRFDHLLKSLKKN